jgi:Leucine-rich repeat (LRR) protein
VVLGVRRHRSSSSSASSSSSSSSGKEEVVGGGGVDVVAKSLAELNRLKGTATKLHLVSSEDIVCRDIQCERVTRSCACKLAVALEKSGQNLREIDLSGNNLDSVPESLFEKCANLERLSLRNNKLTVEAIGKHYKLRKLKLLELGGNPGMELSVECYNRLAKRNVKVRV